MQVIGTEISQPPVTKNLIPRMYKIYFYNFTNSPNYALENDAENLLYNIGYLIMNCCKYAFLHVWCPSMFIQWRIKTLVGNSFPLHIPFFLISQREKRDKERSSRKTWRLIRIFATWFSFSPPSFLAENRKGTKKTKLWSKVMLFCSFH